MSFTKIIKNNYNNEKSDYETSTKSCTRCDAVLYCYKCEYITCTGSQMGYFCDECSWVYENTRFPNNPCINCGFFSSDEGRCYCDILCESNETSDEF